MTTYEPMPCDICGKRVKAGKAAYQLITPAGELKEQLIAALKQADADEQTDPTPEQAPAHAGRAMMATLFLENFVNANDKRTLIGRLGSMSGLVMFGRALEYVGASIMQGHRACFDRTQPESRYMTQEMADKLDPDAHDRFIWIREDR